MGKLYFKSLHYFQRKAIALAISAAIFVTLVCHVQRQRLLKFLEFVGTFLLIISIHHFQYSYFIFIFFQEILFRIGNYFIYK